MRTGRGYSLCLALVLASFGSSALAADAPMTCRQLKALIKVVRANHVWAADPEVARQRLSAEALTARLKDQFVEQLDPWRVILTQDEVTRARADLDQVSLVGPRETTDCDAYARAYDVYAAGLRRSLRAVPPLEPGTDDALGADILAAVNASADSRITLTRATDDDGLRRNLVTALALVTRAQKQALDPFTTDARGEAYRVARATFDSMRLKPSPRDQVPQMMATLIVGSLDAHSNYLAKADYLTFINMISGTSIIGVELIAGTGGMYVRDVKSGQPADRSGQIKRGDKVIAINGVALDNVSQDGFEDAIGRHSPIVLTVAGAAGPRDVVLPKVNVETAAVDQLPRGQVTREFESPVGYLKYPSFTHGSSAALVAEARRLIRGGAAALVLDLRGNTGGSLDEAVELVNTLERRGPGVAAIIRDSLSGVTGVGTAPLGYPIEVPLVILIDRMSASASELISGSLQATGRALVLGNSVSFGKGTGQLWQSVDELASRFEKRRWDFWRDSELPDGYLSLTTFEYYLPDGRSTQARGVSPDVVLFPDRDLKDQVSSEAAQPNVLPTPNDLPLGGEDEVVVTQFAVQRRSLGPVRDQIARLISSERANFARQPDPERAAAEAAARAWALTGPTF